MQPETENMGGNTGGNYDEAEEWKQGLVGENKHDNGDVPLAANIDRTFVSTLFNDDNMDFTVSTP